MHPGSTVIKQGPIHQNCAKVDTNCLTMARKLASWDTGTAFRRSVLRKKAQSYQAGPNQEIRGGVSTKRSAAVFGALPGLLLRVPHLTACFFSWRLFE